MTIAALFVETDGVYSEIPGVEVWGGRTKNGKVIVDRDARAFDGLDRNGDPIRGVLGHPPCKRYGKYWSGGPSAKVRRILGDDGGCFASMLAAAQEHKGVFEHPKDSKAWALYGLNRPPAAGGWVRAGLFVPGWTCCVAQGRYGHPAEKMTWLYACGTDDLPDLDWGPCPGRQRLDAGYHSAEERAAAKAAGKTQDRDRGRLTESERLATPRPFAELMVQIARACAA